jgi:hypothetical protein
MTVGIHFSKHIGKVWFGVSVAKVERDIDVARSHLLAKVSE